MADAARGPGLRDDRIAAAVDAQRGGPPARPKRFFKSADVGRRGADFTVLLYGRPAKTPARLDLAVPGGAGRCRPSATRTTSASTAAMA